MTPIQSLAEAVTEQLKEGLIVDRPSVIDLRHNETPPARCGDLFIGVIPSSLTEGPSPDPQMGIDQVLGVRIAITQRTGYVPDDRMLQNAAYDSKRGVLVHAERIVREMRIRRLKIPYLATQGLSDAWGGQFLMEPLRLASSAIDIRSVDARHFHADPPRSEKDLAHCRDFGLLAVLTFSGARYMENVITETQAV